MIVIGVCGSIGTGKTTLCNNLAMLSGWKVVQENAESNPFLAAFYDDMDRWALASQLRFMLDKTLEYEEMSAKSTEAILIDRTIDEDFCVFCSVLRSYKILSDAEFFLIQDLFRLLHRIWKRPDAILYLKDTPENCLSRVLGRGYPGDNKMELEYVKKISDEYDRWSKGFLVAPYIVLEPATLDFRLPETGRRVLDDLRSLLRLR
jgi:deoxyadenosine/deoxycytidine kinase